MESELNGKITFKILSKINIFSMIDKIPKLGILKETTAVNRMIITTIVSELAWNILKYAQQGEIRLCRSVLGSRVNIDIWAQDNGPGIVNVDVALQESYSSGGTLGLGLPAVKRMSDLFWIKSDVGQGTLVLARKCIKELKPNFKMEFSSFLPVDTNDLVFNTYKDYEISATIKPFDHNVVGGDAAVIIECEGGFLLSIIDVSGHGDEAHVLAQGIVAFIKDNASSDLVKLMKKLNAFLMLTRGAAVSLVYINTVSHRLHYLGVGNTNAALVGDNKWRGVSREGVLGGRIPSMLVEDVVELTKGDAVLLWTDGLPSQEVITLFRSISWKSATQISQQLITDLRKHYDDAGCLVFKWLK
ncbi:MAG: hypothetical protein RLZ75_650 [Pseudomonadota bacterium]